MTAHTAKAGRFAGLIFSACLALLLIPAQAQAGPPEVIGPLSITVDKKNYDIKLLQNTSFADNSTFLTNGINAPWWGNEDVALLFRNAYATKFLTFAPSGGPYPALFAAPAAESMIMFAYNQPIANGGVSIHFIYAGDTSFLTISGPLPPTALDPAAAYAYVVASPSSVPEINAGSLAQAMLILLAFWLVTRPNNRPLHALRRQDPRP
jgi:hypothetical protein